MAEQPDESQKTEDPTPKRLEDARKKGDVPKSQEITVLVSLAATATGIMFFAKPAAEGFVRAMTPFLDHPHDIVVEGGSLDAIYMAAVKAFGLTFASVAAVAIIGAVLGNVLQATPRFSAEKLKPKFSKLSPIAGAKRLLGPEALVNFVKGLAKLAIVGALIAYVVWPDRDALIAALFVDPASMLATARDMSIKMIAAAIAAMIIVAALDYAWQRHSWMKRQRMSMKEIKDEMKETDGDPQIKARIRQIRHERAQRRMMAAVPDATVVVMNPTHFAVALQYEEGQAGAPVCVAKGQDALALKIRDVAKEAGVPVVQNPPLARALFASVDIDEEIPVDHYEAVAKLIGFVLRQAAKRRRRAS